MVSKVSPDSPVVAVKFESYSGSFVQLSRFFDVFPDIFTTNEPNELKIASYAG